MVGYISIIEASSQDRRVIPVVWIRNGGVHRGFDIGNRRDSRDGIGWRRRPPVNRSVR